MLVNINYAHKILKKKSLKLSISLWHSINDFQESVPRHEWNWTKIKECSKLLHGLLQSLNEHRTALDVAEKTGSLRDKPTVLGEITKERMHVEFRLPTSRSLDHGSSSQIIWSKFMGGFIERVLRMSNLYIYIYIYTVASSQLVTAPSLIIPN